MCCHCHCNCNIVYFAFAFGYRGRGYGYGYGYGYYIQHLHYYYDYDDDVRCMMSQLKHQLLPSCSLVIHFQQYGRGALQPTLNLAMHPRAGRDQHNQNPLGRFGFSLGVTATMADGASPAHTVRVIMAFSKQPLLGGDEQDRCLLTQRQGVVRCR